MVGSNLAEAVRAVQLLLDDYAVRLMPNSSAAGEGRDTFTTVRKRVLDLLRDSANAELLDRYRAMEQTEAQRLLADGSPAALERLALTRSLTEPGLEAMLRLAQRDLEAGRFRTAVDRLREAVVHPDILNEPRRGAHAWFMLGTASHYSGLLRSFESAVNEMAMMGRAREHLLDELEALRGAIPIGPAVGVSPFDRSRAGDLSGLVAEEIWSVDLNDAPQPRQSQSRSNPIPGLRTPPGAGRSNAEDGQLATMMPTVVELFDAAVAGEAGHASGPSVVYINQGHTITALDRFTGNRIWERDYVDRSTLLLVDRTGEPIMDPNVIAVRGDALVTITGHAHGSSRSSDGRVVCLDARSGDLRWAVRLDRLEIGTPTRRVGPAPANIWGEEVEGLFPHGRPLIVEDVVLIKARRITPQALTSAYVIAFDLQTGDLRWVRHVASSGSIRRSGRLFAAMVAAPPAAPMEGDEMEVVAAGAEALSGSYDVFLVTAIGAAARLNPRTGEIIWLHRFPVPLQSTAQDIDVRPWEVVTPHVMRSRVIAPHPGRRQVAVYDRETGELLAIHETTGSAAWKTPAYLLGDDEWLYAVSANDRSITAFRSDDLTNAAWSFAPRNDRIRGRVQLTDVGLIVPTATGLTVLDRQTGEGIAELPIEPARGSDEQDERLLAGTAVAFDSQIIFASDRRLTAYMSLERAEHMLRERIAAGPLNPEPALSLTRLALRACDLALALEAGGHALAAIEAQDDREPAPVDGSTPRDRLVSLLLELDEDGVARNRDEVEMLFSLVEQAARTPAQQLALRIAYGDRLVAQDNPSAALTQWQVVLSDRDLAEVDRVENAVERPGRAWATARIAEAVRRFGEDIYEPYERAASRRFDELMRQQPREGELIALAEEFPYAAVAVDGLLAASRILAEEGAAQRALAVLRSLDRVPHRHADRLRAAFADLAQDLGREALARAADRTASPADRSLPAVGPPSGSAQVLRGQILVPPADSDESPPTDRILLGDREVLTMLATAEGDRSALTTLWTHNIGDDSSSCAILNWNAQTLLIAVATHSDPRVVAIDSASGEVRWRTRPFSELFPAAVRAAGVRTGPTGEQFHSSAVIATADRETLLLAQRSGNLTALDVGRGGELLWQRAAEDLLDEIHFMSMRGGLLAISGSSVRGAAATVIDSRTGESVLPGLVPLDADALWFTLSPNGSVYYGGRTGVGCIDVWRGEHAWVNVAFEAIDPKRAWLGTAAVHQERLYIEDRDADLHVIDTHTGALSVRFDMPDWEPPSPRPGMPNMQPVAPGAALLDVAAVEDGQALGHFRGRIVRYSADGAIIGADVLSGDRNYAWLFRARDAHHEGDSGGGDRLVLINVLPTTPGAIPGSPVGSRRPQHNHHLYVLTADARLLHEPVALPPLPEPVRLAQLVDGWLFLSLSSRTVAVPMP